MLERGHIKIVALTPVIVHYRDGSFQRCFYDTVCVGALDLCEPRF